MCCILAALGLIGPRMAFAVWWLLDRSKVVSALGGDWWVALLGLIFLPWTALAWVAVWSPSTHVSGFGWALVAVGFLADLSSLGSGKVSRAKDKDRA